MRRADAATLIEVRVLVVPERWRLSWHAPLRRLRGAHHLNPLQVRELEDEHETTLIALGNMTAAWDRQMNEIAELKADNARLREIVGRLPKTADGVPITPGMEAFLLPDHPVVATAVLSDQIASGMAIESATENCPAHYDELGVFWFAEAIYSTRAAAEAAREAKG